MYNKEEAMRYGNLARQTDIDKIINPLEGQQLKPMREGVALWGTL
jgi:hypothetical protein